MDSLTLNTTTSGGLADFNYLYISTNANASISGNNIKGLLAGTAEVSLQVRIEKNVFTLIIIIFQSLSLTFQRPKFYQAIVLYVMEMQLI